MLAVGLRTAVILAQVTQDLIAPPGIDLTFQNLTGLVTKLACWVSEVAGIALFVAIVFYGILYTTSKGMPDRVTKAGKGLLYSLIGGVIIFGSYAIIATVANAIGGDYPVVPINCSSGGSTPSELDFLDKTNPELPPEFPVPDDK